MISLKKNPNPNIWNPRSKRQRSHRAQEPPPQLQTSSKHIGLCLVTRVQLETPQKASPSPRDAQQLKIPAGAHTGTFALRSRHLCRAHWCWVSVLPPLLLHYKVCKVTVGSDDFEESTLQEKVLKIHQGRACKIGVLCSAWLWTSHLLIPLHLRTRRSRACAQSPLLQGQRRWQSSCAPRGAKSDAESRLGLPTSPKKPRQTGTLTWIPRMSFTRWLHVSPTGRSNHEREKGT